MIIYTENDTESDKRIKNNNLKNKIHQQCQNAFEQSQRFQMFVLLFT